MRRIVRSIVYIFGGLGLCHFSSLKGADVWSSPLPIALILQNFSHTPGLCYDSQNNRFFAAYSDGTGTLYYSIFSNGSWSAAQTIPVDSQTKGPISLVYDSTNHRVFAAWADVNDNRPYSSIYSGGSWGALTPIDVSGFNAANRVVSLCYDTTNDQVFAAYGNGVTAYYSIYTGGGWSANSFIDSTDFTFQDVYICYDSTNDRVFATWADLTSRNPIYSIYSNSMMSWSPAAVIDTAAAQENVFVSYDPTNDRVLATWGGMGQSFPYYAIYSGGMWSAANSFATSTTAASNVLTCYNSSTNQFFAAWGNNSQSIQPTFSIFSSGSWSTPLPIAPQSTFFCSECFLAFGNGTVMAAWSNATRSNAFPIYSTYPSVLNSPGALTGIQKENNFGVVQEFYNALSWSAGTLSNVAAYLIYRDGVQIATVGSNTFTYEDHNRPKKLRTIYSVYAQSTSGEISSAATVVVN